ncbi:MAG: Crp/Fnr family transcriptional regulator [Anaerolineae bacterium]
MAVTIEEITEFLGKVPMFQGLKPRQLKKLAARARVRDYTAGTAIVEQGDEGIGLYIMARGIAEVQRRSASGDVRILDTLERFAFFGELSLLDDATRSASVIAQTDVKAVVLTKLDFLDELEDDPQMAIVMLKQLAHRFRRIVTNM